MLLSQQPVFKTDEDREVEGVARAWSCHIRNYDIRISTIAVALASAITMISIIAGRMMWYGGDERRSDRDDDSGLGNNGLFVCDYISLALAFTLVQLFPSTWFGKDASSVGWLEILKKLVSR